jgi:cation:H+ antiporter
VLNVRKNDVVCGSINANRTHYDLRPLHSPVPTSGGCAGLVVSGVGADRRRRDRLPRAVDGSPSVHVVLASLLAVGVGFGLLTYAADQFVDGSARLAGILRLPPVIIGAVVIGFGTSAPELLVSGIAAGQNNVDVGVGNIVGSTVANLTLVLGAAAVMLPIAVRPTILRRAAPLSTGSVVVFAVLVQGGFRIWEGVVMLALLAGALTTIVRGPGGENAAREAGLHLSEHHLGRAMVRTLLGLVGTVSGAWALVWGALRIAEELGLSDGFVGLSLVAVGTSLPELVTAVAASRRGEQELIVGNLLGSNLFNSLAVAGVIALLAPGIVPEESLQLIGVVIMAVVALTALGLMITRGRVARWEGELLLVGFVAFLAVSYATQPDEAAAGKQPAQRAAMALSRHRDGHRVDTGARRRSCLALPASPVVADLDRSSGVGSLPPLRRSWLACTVLGHRLTESARRSYGRPTASGRSPMLRAAASECAPVSTEMGGALDLPLSRARSR